MSTSARGTASWLAARLACRGVHYGWVVAAITFGVLLTTAAMRALPGVLLRPLEAEFHWERAAITVGVAISLLLYGVVGPVVGRLMDSLGPRRVILGALALMGAAGLGVLCMDQVWQFDLLWGVLVGAGSGAAASVLTASVVSRWFVARRGTVTGLLSAATSAGQIVFVPTAMWLALAAGWRASVLLILGLMLLVIAPLVVVWFRDSPAEVGQRPFGERTSALVSAAPEAGERTPLRVALRSPDFWWIAGGFFICGYTTNGLIATHFIPHATEHGVGELAAASILGLIGGTSVLGTIASGMLCDRVRNRRWLLATFYLFRGLSLLLLPLISSSTTLLTVFGVLYGLNWFATAPVNQVLLMDLFGRRSVAQIYGWVFFGHQLGSALAAYLGGWVHDRVGSYEPVFVAAGCAGVVAAAFALQLREGRRGVLVRPATA
ncbi:MAG: MFS transporter [Chloroflexi bacterium]|nr:MFS transporter [Chloroflexota bacterium]